MSGLIPFHDLVEALEAAPAGRPFVTAWIDEDEQETVTFGEFRERGRTQAGLLLEHGIGAGDRVVILMPQGIAAMSAFAGAMMLGAVPAFLAYPNFKVEAEKYRSGLAGVTANLKAKAVVIDEAFPEEMVGHVSLGAETKLLGVLHFFRQKNRTRTSAKRWLQTHEFLQFLKSRFAEELQKSARLAAGDH